MTQLLYDLLHNCTVLITIPGESRGTGFFIAPGLILTCAHVVEAAQKRNTFVEVHWNGQVLAAQIQEYRDVPYPDLALLQVNLSNHPCVLLQEEAEPFGALYSYGYPDIKPQGASTTFTSEGWAGDQQELLRLKQGQVRPGMSGSPLLNRKTGGVCGIFQVTRDPNTDLGGEALVTRVVFREFLGLESEQQRFHKQNRQWLLCLASYQADFVLSSFQMLSQQYLAEQGERGFFEILKLRRATWSLITQGNYIDRDQQKQSLATAKRLADFRGISLLVLRGLPGNGKTALLLWLAYQLCVHGNVVLCNNTKPIDYGWLKELHDFSRKIGGQHFYLIIDDIFREDVILNELKNCQERFPLTIIGTTLSEDDRHEELEGLHEIASPIDIQPPSNEEKQRVLDKVSQDPAIKAKLNRLTNEERQTLLEAPTMLVLIWQISEVKHFDQIVADIIKRLPSTRGRQDDLPAYEIFGTICSFSQLGIISPADIVASCVSKEISRKVTSASILRSIESPGLRGLVVAGQKAGYDGFQVFHEHFARKVMETSYKPYPRDNPPYPLILLQQNLEVAIKNLDVENELHRRWVYASLRRLVATGQREVVRQTLNSCTEKIYALQVRNNVLGWFSWAEIYKGVGLLNESERCLNAVLSTQPHSDWDWSFWLGQVESRGTNAQKQQAKFLVSQWLQGNNEDNVGVRAKYLNFLGEYGTEAEVLVEIDKTSFWLKDHPNDTNIRNKYLEMVGKRGTLVQKLRAVCEMIDWLEQNQPNSNMRAQFLRFISQPWAQEARERVVMTTNFNGTLESLIHKFLNEIIIWLNDHKFDKTSDVRTAHLDLLSKRGTLEQKQETMKVTTDWLREYRTTGRSDWLHIYPNASVVFAKYLVLLRVTNLEALDVQSIIVESWQWINELWESDRNKVDQLSWTAYLPLLGRCNDPRIISDAISCVLAQFPNIDIKGFDRVRGIILSKHRNCLTPEMCRQLAQQLSESIVGTKLAVNELRPYLIVAANALRDIHDFDAAEKIYLRLIRWSERKLKKDAQETFKIASENYEQLLRLKEQSGGSGSGRIDSPKE